MKMFRNEYIAHVLDKRCPAGVCKALLKYTIDPDKCKKCSLCTKQCPVGAISGQVGKTPFVIDPDKCIRCGACMASCRFGAIIRK
jgi:NADP-reducing hydrogenase subunit HndC